MRVDHEKREIVCSVGVLVYESIHRRIGVERDGFRRITAESLAERRDDIRDTYHKLSDRTPSPPLPLGEFRSSGEYEAFVLGSVVETLS